MKLEHRVDLEAGRPAEPSQMEPTPSEDSVRVKAEGQALLDAADAAISRALSRDSREFLAQGRQTGGQ